MIELLEKQAALGSGGRFKALTRSLKAKGAKDPAALAAYIGRKKYGVKGMAALAKRGTKGAKTARREASRIRRGTAEGLFPDVFRERLLCLAAEAAPSFDLDSEILRLKNSAKTANNFARAATDAGIKELYRKAEAGYLQLARDMLKIKRERLFQ